MSQPEISSVFFCNVAPRFSKADVGDKRSEVPLSARTTKASLGKLRAGSIQFSIRQLVQQLRSHRDPLFVTASLNFFQNELW